MYQHWQMTLPLLLSVYYRYYRSGPSTGYPNIQRSGYLDIRSTAPVLRLYGLLRFGGRSHGSPRRICGMGSLLGSAVVVGSLLRWVARKTSLAKSPADPSRNPQMIGVAQRGRLKVFLNVVLAHYLDY